MDQAFAQRPSEALRDMSSPGREAEGAGVPMEVRILTGHGGEPFEVIGVGDAAAGGAVSGDHGHAAFEREPERRRVCELGPDDGDGVFPAGVLQRVEVALEGVGGKPHMAQHEPREKGVGPAQAEPAAAAGPAIADEMHMPVNEPRRRDAAGMTGGAGRHAAK